MLAGQWCPARPSDRLLWCQARAVVPGIRTHRGHTTHIRLYSRHAYEYAYHQFIHTVVELNKYEWEKLVSLL